MSPRAQTGRLRGGALVLCVLLCLACPLAARAAGPPTLGTTWASEVGPESATANAFVNPQGLSTTWRFEYLSDAAYSANLTAGREAFAGAAAAPAPGGAPPASSSRIVSWPLSGLAPSTTYHLRTVATNSAGTVASLAPPLFATGTTQVPCEGDACQPLPAAPEDPRPGTQAPTLGNPPVRFPKHRHARRRHHRHGHHHRRRRG